MSFTWREIWTIVHGMVLGGLLLLGFSGVIVGFWNLRPNRLEAAATAKQIRTLLIYLLFLTGLAWMTVILGSYFPYAWYRATPPAGADLTQYPMFYLLSKPGFGFWEEYGMEWKEHLAWFVPILLTVVTFIFGRYREKLLGEPGVRKALMIFLLIAFAASAISGFLGAFVTKIAPVR